MLRCREAAKETCDNLGWGSHLHQDIEAVVLIQFSLLTRFSLLFSDPAIKTKPNHRSLFHTRKGHYHGASFKRLH